MTAPAADHRRHLGAEVPTLPIAAHTHPDARVLLFSHRNTRVELCEVPLLEFEDVIRAVDRVDMVAPAPGPLSTAGRVAGGVRNRVRAAVGRPKDWYEVPDAPVGRDYDFFFASFHYPPTLAYLEKLKGVRERCRVMACFLVEMWSPQIPSFAPYVRLLETFDHVFLFNSNTVGEVARRTGRPAHFLPTATDALRFAPVPHPPPRAVDVYAIGRGSTEAHREFYAMAERGEIYYVHAFDKPPTGDYLAHRLLTASTLQRTRYFPAWRINENRARLTGGEEALATRYFEGAAAGAVMVGSAPDIPDFRDNFDWPDAVVPLAYTPRPGEVRALLAELDADPERTAAARRQNVVQSLRRHDWVHRWRQVLDTVGLPPTPGMAARVARLEQTADVAAGLDFEGPPRAATLARSANDAAPPDAGAHPAGALQVQRA